MRPRMILIISLVLFAGCSGGARKNGTTPAANDDRSPQQRVDAVRNDLLPPSQLGIGADAKHRGTP